MAAQTDVQFFSHLNTLAPQLTNDWGCMINLLDACLVNGVTLPVVTSASVEKDTGNITVNFNTPHTCLLFQCVTLSGFTPNAMNGKYRIIGVPSTTQLTLSSDLSAQSATTMGTAKLSPLGYEIVFSATSKRVYRALNPTAQHPYIRVDESLSSADGTTGVYTSTYAKSAMVGLIENMSHIVDYLDTSKLQLPLDTTDFAKNWKISGTGTNVVRGWAKWYWATNTDPGSNIFESIIPNAATWGRAYTLCGNKDAFYLLNGAGGSWENKRLQGCGLFNSCMSNDIIPNWFLMSTISNISASLPLSIDYLTPIAGLNIRSTAFLAAKYSIASPISNSISAYGITPDLRSGFSAIAEANNVSALGIPFKDSNEFLRGNIPHVYYSCKLNMSANQTKPVFSDSSMYIIDSCYTDQNTYSQYGTLYFYLGEMS